MYNVFMSKKHTVDESKFKFRSRKLFGKPTVPSAIQFLVVKGIVKNEFQAISLLAAIFIALFSASICILNSVNVPIAILDHTLSAASR